MPSIGLSHEATKKAEELTQQFPQHFQIMDFMGGSVLSYPDLPIRRVRQLQKFLHGKGTFLTWYTKERGEQ